MTADKPKPGRKAYGEKSKTRVTGAKNQPARRKSKTLVREMVRGKPYIYYPLGKYLVAAPGRCGGQPSFKYTRVRAKRALDLIAEGASIDEVASKLNNKHIPPAAISEALELARKAFAKKYLALRRVKRWV